MPGSSSSSPFGDEHDSVIIVDDDLDDTFLLRRLLQRANIQHPAVTFSDARRAMEYLSYLSNETPGLVPCLLFTDLHMSPIDGVEFITWIRGQPQLQKLRVVALSGWEQGSDTQRALAAGANVCLPKFPSPEELRAALLPKSGEQ